MKRYSSSSSDQPQSSRDTLPDPSGPLSGKVPSEAIAAANKEVTKVLDKSCKDDKSGRGPYLTLTSAQRFTIGKRAAEYGTTAAIRYFMKKYPELPPKETTVWRLKNLYHSQLRLHHDDISSAESVKELPTKKTGRPLMTGDELDKQVSDYIGYLRSAGAVVNTSVVITSAKGILMHKDANLLLGIDLTKGWAKYLLNRMGYVKRKATSKAKVTVANCDELKEDYLLEIKHVVEMDEIPPELIVNFDQTGLNFFPVSEWTMEAEGAKRVEVTGKDDKRQLTAVLGGSLVGDFLPPQLIYEGKTPRCLPRFEFPEKWHITYSSNHWSNESTMKEYIQHVLLPYIDEKRKNLKLANDYPALVTYDNFKGQCTPDILTLLDVRNINIVLIPPNCTDRLQLLDLSVNKAVKDQLRSQF